MDSPWAESSLLLRVGLEVLAFDNFAFQLAPPIQSRQIPEPTSVWGLLAVFGLGIRVLSKWQNQ